MIILVHQYNDYSGSPRVLKSVVEVLRNSNIDYSLFIGGGSEGYFTTDEFKSFNYSRTNNKFLNIVSFFISQLVLFFKLLTYRNKDIVIYINTLLPFGAAIFAIVYRKRFIYHIHEVSIKPKVFSTFLNYFARKSSKIFVVSSYVRNFYEDVFAKTLLVPNCVSIELASAAQDFNYANCLTNKTVTMIASLRVYKGVNEFLILAKYFKEENVKFLLVLNASIEEYTLFFKGKRIPENVKVLCNVKSIDDIYKQTTLLLNLSDSEIWIETFGLTLLEAMTFGVPVIAPKVGGHLDFIVSGECGYLIDSKDIKALVDKIDFLINNPQACLGLSKNAKIEAKNWSFDRFNSNLIKNLL